MARVWRPAGRGHYIRIETGERVTTRQRAERIREAQRVGQRRYRSMLVDFREKKARQAGYRSYLEARQRAPRRFGKGVDFRKRREFQKIVESLRGLKATDRRSAERKMHLLENLGRSITRPWQFYLDHIPQVGEEYEGEDIEDVA